MDAAGKSPTDFAKSPRGVGKAHAGYRANGDNWVDGPTSTQARNIPVLGLTPGTMSDFHVQTGVHWHERLRHNRLRHRKNLIRRVNHAFDYL